MREPQALPLWFRPDNPASRPIVSHHAATNNVLLKITVPKRTGRKRKRGSDEPFSGDTDTSVSNAMTLASQHTIVGSVGQRDPPKRILRKLQDNPDRYQAEAVGIIRDSHRYRGLADFQFASSNMPFLKNVAEHLLPLNCMSVFKSITKVSFKY